MIFLSMRELRESRDAVNINHEAARKASFLPFHDSYSVLRKKKKNQEKPPGPG